MAKLIELIKRATRTEPGPIGFGATSRKPQPTMLLVALATDHWPRGAADAVAAGADAVLLAGRPADKDIAEAVKAADGRPCGLLAPDAAADQVSRLREAGLDFLAVGVQAGANVLLDEGVTFLLHLREELTDVQLRAVEPMPFAGVYAERDAAPATIMRMIELQRLSGLTRKPLLLTLPPESKEEDLLSLREAGVALVAVDLRERGATDALRRLRGVIDGLPRRRKPRSEERAAPSLPSGGGRAGPAEGEEEEEEE